MLKSRCLFYILPIFLTFIWVSQVNAASWCPKDLKKLKSKYAIAICTDNELEKVYDEYRFLWNKAKRLPNINLSKLHTTDYEEEVWRDKNCNSTACYIKWVNKRIKALEKLVGKTNPKQKFNISHKSSNKPAPQKISNNTQHSHNGRSHSHLLPKQGINHRHGNGALGKAVTRNNNIATSSRQKQNTFSKPATAGISKYIARDQNNCIHYVKYPEEGVTKRVKWTGKCVNGYAKGAGKRTWFSNGKQDGSTSWMRKVNAKSRIDREIKYQKKKELEKNEVITRKSQMLNFVNRYNIRSILSPDPKSSSSWDVDGAADWASTYNFPTMDTAGKTGNIYLTFSYKGKRYEGRIYGKFADGSLVGEGSVNIERTVKGSCGFWSCERISKNYKITASSDIRAKLLSGAAHIAPQLGPAARRVAREKAAKASSSSSYSSSSQKYGCKFYCEGSFGARKSPRFQENTPMTNSSDAQKYIKEKWDSRCSKNYSGAYGVNIPSCETYYYE
ncbi:hypothetical protein [uncultured Cocleimonas sp.]|uniref:hypothetical protein n=1 Tax=uncultured Cocleimonas sp. TaxID=1051587 RepID=UPI002614A1B0|nr:hypothetical protein [uncultured Cocleimonas sp.]